MKKTLCALIGAAALSIGNMGYTQDTAKSIETDLKNGKNVIDMITLPESYAQKGEMKYNNSVWGKESKAVVHYYTSTIGDDRIQIEASYVAPLDKMEDNEGVKQYLCNQTIYDNMFKNDTLRYITLKKGNCSIIIQNRIAKKNAIKLPEDKFKVYFIF